MSNQSESTLFCVSQYEQSSDQYPRCGVAQLVARRLAVRQARVRFSARHHREGLPTELIRRWGDGERPRQVATDCMNVIEWIYMFFKIWKINQKEWHHATKPLKISEDRENWSPLSNCYLHISKYHLAHRSPNTRFYGASRTYANFFA